MPICEKLTLLQDKVHSLKSLASGHIHLCMVCNSMGAPISAHVLFQIVCDALDLEDQGMLIHVLCQIVCALCPGLGAHTI